MPTKTEIGQLGIMIARLTERMEALGLNALSTAKKANLGDDYVRDLLRGKVKQPSAIRLSQLAAALETSPDYLMGGADPTPRPPPRISPGPVQGQSVAALTRLVTGHDLEVAFPVYIALCEKAAWHMTYRLLPGATPEDLTSITGIHPGVPALHQLIGRYADLSVMASLLHALGAITEERRQFLSLIGELRTIWLSGEVPHDHEGIKVRIRKLLEYAGISPEPDDEHIVRLKLGYAIVDLAAEAAPIDFDVDGMIRDVMGWLKDPGELKPTPDLFRDLPRI